MSNETIKEVSLHLWRVSVSAQTDERKYLSNYYPLVMADTPEDALSIVREKYHGCSVWGIQHITGPKRSQYQDNPVLVREEAK